MWNDFLTVAGSVATLFLMMAVGFFFAKRGMLDNNTISQLSGLLLYAVTPAIIVSTFSLERTPQGDRQLLTAALALVGTYALYMALSVPLFRRQPERTRGVLRFASIYGNKGFMGLPLVQAALGGEATMVAALALAFFNIVTWTHGVAVIGGRERLSVKKAFLNPAVLGFAAALTLYLTGWQLPGPVDKAVDYMGSLNTPLAMVIIGGQMAGSDLAAVFRDRRLYAVSALKLAVLPALTMLVLLPFRLDSIIYLTLVILSGCPTAGVTSMFAQMMEKDTVCAARQVTLSTLLSILTLPLAALFAKLLIS